jgi:hypothetical protein
MGETMSLEDELAALDQVAPEDCCSTVARLLRRDRAFALTSGGFRCRRELLQLIESNL